MSEAKFRRHSVPVMPAAGMSILITDYNKATSSNRLRRVSFEKPQLSLSVNHQLQNSEQKTRRHSVATGPPSNGGLRAPLTPLSETGHVDGNTDSEASAMPPLTAAYLIEACLKDADDFEKPFGIPAGSSDMAAILRDMRSDSDSTKSNGVDTCLSPACPGNFLSPPSTDVSNDTKASHSDSEVGRNNKEKVKTERVRKISAYSITVRR